ncbi:MAG TPA: endolytic transglycosylase MltG [Gemmatimonadaceae bacterium]
MRGRARVAVAVILAVLVGAAACSSPSGPGVQLTIRKGSSFREAAESLSAHGLVRSARVFSLYATVRHRDRSLRWGTYVLRPGMSWEQMLDALRLGRGVIHVVTIPEGFSIADIEPLLEDSLDLAQDSLEAAVRDTALLHQLDIPTHTLEGYLFPDTYTFPDKTTARDAVRMMVDRFERAWKPEWTDQARSMKLTRHDIVTLASIVEREVRRDEERPVVAAVYLNRLKIGMPLMADPTITYALGRKPGRVLLKDLRVKSPYNTYLKAGLPPGPIASPGAASMRASLYPAKVPYRFFVAAPDGHHEFRRTYEQHLEAIRILRGEKKDTLKP